MIIACLLLNFLQHNFENRLVNKVFMIGCVTCPWAPTAVGTTAQTNQRNDGATALDPQQLHHWPGHINRTVHADIEKPTKLEKIFNCLHKINYYVSMKKNTNFAEKICIDCWHNTVLWYTTHNTQYTIHSWFIISFEIFFLASSRRFWRDGLYELDWFRDRRQLNSLLTATDYVCWQR